MSIPFGTIIAYVGNKSNLNTKTTEGWLLCDGSGVKVSDYPDLNEAIGDTFGTPKAGYFNLPDLQGQFLRGVDTSGLVDPDAQHRTSPSKAKDPSGAPIESGPIVGSRQDQQLLNHQHNWNRNFGAIDANGGDINVQLTETPSPSKDPNLPDQPTTDIDGGGNETRPVNVYVYYLIYAFEPTSKSALKKHKHK